jgi:MATE family multidrug resistance protein
MGPKGFLSFRSEAGPVFRLAAPIALMQTGMVFYGTVTTLMMGRIGPGAIAGVGLGNSLYFMIFVCAAGVLLGIDPLSSRAFGAGRPAECARVLAHAAFLAVGAGLPVFPALLFTASRQYLQSMGITRTQLIAVIAGNGLNLCLGWALVFGRFGFPALGVEGAGWAPGSGGSSGPPGSGGPGSTPAS